MKDKNIQQLIDRYLAGETSNEEERRLALALHEVHASRGKLPEDWRAVQLMLGELTLGEALYDEILARRSSSRSAHRHSKPNIYAASTGSKNHRLRVWHWAAAAVIVLAVGIGIALYQMETPQRTVTSVSTTSGTSEYHQWYKQVPPVVQAHAASNINKVEQSHQPTRTVASANTNRHKRKSVQPKITPSGTDLPSPIQEERAEEPLLAAAEAGQQTEIDQYQSLSHDDDPYAAIEAEMREIRSRGERLQRMLDEIINDKTMLANHLN